MTAHDSMAGLSVLNPILILPLASPSSTHFPVTSPESSPLWDCELLKPVRSCSALAFAAPTPDGLRYQDTSIDVTICEARHRLSEILGLAHEKATVLAESPVLLSPLDLVPPYTDIDIATPITPEPLSLLLQSMPPHGNPHNPRSPQTAGGHKSKTPRSSFRFRQRTPKSSLSRSFRLAAPAPRIPLASVLQSWAAHESQEAMRARGNDEMDVDPDGWQHEPEHGCDCARDQAVDSPPAERRTRGLGLLLGFGQPPPPRVQPTSARARDRDRSQAQASAQSHSHPHSHDSQAQTKFSRRLRRLAPAPLQLASATPRHAPYTPARGPGTTCPRCGYTSAPFVNVPLHTAGLPPYEPEPEPIPDDIPSLDLEATSPRSPRNIFSSAFSGMTARLRARTKTAVSPSAMPFSPRHAYTKHDDREIPIHDLFTQPNAAPMNMNTDSNPNPTSNLDQTKSPVPIEADPSVSYIDPSPRCRTISRARGSLISPTSPYPHPYARTPKSSQPAAPPLHLPNAAAPVPVPVPVPTLAPAAQSPTTPAGPPAMRRSDWLVPLPDMTFADPESPERDRRWDWDWDAGEGEGARADLRLDLDAEDLALRAEKCAEAIARASYVSLASLSPLFRSSALLFWALRLTLCARTVAALVQPAQGPRRACGPVRAPAPGLRGGAARA